MAQDINVGLIGYGFGGRIFHAPFISAVQGLNLYKVRETNPDNVAHLKRSYPNAQIVSDSEEIFKDEAIQLVVITTLNTFHYELACKALQSGKHVVVDKPFTITSREADLLIELARVEKKILSVFHNRRWDSDFRTVKRILDEKLLGDLVSYEAHFDRFKPDVSENWRDKKIPGSGMLYDLGSHLIDQALNLFGIPDEILADVEIQRPDGTVDDSFEVILKYPKLKATLKSGMLVRELGPHFTLHGTKGSFVKYGMDVQEEELISGKRPAAAGPWGIEPESLHGRINTEINGSHITGKVESDAGDYREYYRNVLNAIKGIESIAVTPTEARNVIRVIELAEQSHKEKRWVRFQP